MPKPSEWAHTAAELIKPLTSRWALAGALAARLYRLAPRGTVDADILVEWVPGLTQRFEQAGYDVREIADPEAGHPHLLIARRGDERVDLIIPTVPYQQLALDRAVDNVLTVEDVIVHKLIAWRPRDQDDIASVLAAEHDLDEQYIEHWAAEWEVLDRWRRAAPGTEP